MNTTEAKRMRQAMVERTLEKAWARLERLESEPESTEHDAEMEKVIVTIHTLSNVMRRIV